MLSWPGGLLHFWFTPRQILKLLTAFLHADKEQLHFMVVSNVTNQTSTTLPSPNDADWLFLVLFVLGCSHVWGKKGQLAKYAKNPLRPDKSWNDSQKYKHIFLSGQPSARCVPAFALSIVPSALSVISSRVMSFECLNDAQPLFLLLFLSSASLYLSRRGNSLSFPPRPLHSNQRAVLYCTCPAQSLVENYPADLQCDIRQP